VEQSEGYAIFDFNLDPSKRSKWSTGSFLEPNSPFFSKHVEIGISQRNSQSRPDSQHFHRETKEFYLVISGQLVLQINNKTIILKPLEMVVVLPNSIHAVIKAVDDTKFIVIKSPSGLNDKVIVP
jgi:mannose-6-phosphate isomerase-like protein (cupin superfamily)